MIGTKETEITVARLVDEREQIHRKHESKLAEINSRTDPMPNPDERELLKGWSEQRIEFDEQIGRMSKAIADDRLADDESKKVRRLLSSHNPAGVDVDDDGVVYRDYQDYVRDFFITRSSVREVDKMIRQWGIPDNEVALANERLQLLKRVPTNTLSSNVIGLSPPQHISQIMQVIDKSRNLVNAATKAPLNRGTLTYPQVDTTPVVLAQSAEKTEGGTTGLAVSMVTRTATVYLGGGDLSWQAIQWSDPNALRLWFDEIAADYALKTETDAATIVSASGFLSVITSPLASTPTFAQLMTAIGAGYSKVWSQSGRTADTVIMAPDRFGYVIGLTSDAFSQFVNVGSGGVGPLKFLVSRGLNAGEIIVGDISALLCAETPGAPVEMQVVEPAIGGVEVGLIGAFEAAVTDDGAFATITTAS